MKIYTKTGDRGDTGLMGGKRVSKDSLRVHAYGEVDELNAVLGLCVVETDASDTVEWRLLGSILHQLQRELFSLGSDLSTPLESMLAVPRLTAKHIQQLERWIDEIEAQLPPLKNFILPGGSPLASRLHFARTVCRRAERALVALRQEEAINDQNIVYMNRLSDLLFMMARLANHLRSVTEEVWISEKNP